MFMSLVPLVMGVVGAQEPQPAAPVALEGGTVIDGTGALPRPNTTIIVQGERITALGPAGGVAVPSGATRIDVAGKYVLPGFVNLHVHLTYPPGPARQSESLGTLRALHFADKFLRAGVTSLRDVGGTIESMQALLRAGQLGYVETARVFPVGQLITSTGGHGTSWSHFASGADGFREAVRKMYEAGFRHIKLSPYYTAEEVSAAVEEAKMRGMRVTSHGGGYSDTSPVTMTRLAVMAGVQCIEHANEMPDEVLDLIAERGVHLVPTMAILRTLYRLPNTIPTIKELVANRGWSIDLHERIFKKALAKGVVMGIGTDAVGTLLDEKYPGMYLEEMEYFVQLGMSRLAAITAATKNGALVLGRERDLGTLEVGKLADLQVVDGDPLASFASLGRPRLVMVGGKVRHPGS